MNRKLRFGQIGGGHGAFIGPIHRIAATMDGEAELIAGAFSSNPDKSRAAGRKLLLDPSRVYSSYEEMARREASMSENKRLDFVIVTTPNSTHHPIVTTFLKAGFNVICDKPLAISLKQAKEIDALVKKHRKVLALTHNYTGYPMVKEARALCRTGALGKINKVVVEYPQGWMTGFITNPGNAIGMWRMDPKICGPSGCIGDLGIHAENLVRYITGLQIEEVCADLSRFIKQNRLEDDGNVLLHYKGGTRGIRRFPRQGKEYQHSNMAIHYSSLLYILWSHFQPFRKYRNGRYSVKLLLLALSNYDTPRNPYWHTLRFFHFNLRLF